MVEEYIVDEKTTTILNDGKLCRIGTHDEVDNEIVLNNNIEMLENQIAAKKKVVNNNSKKKNIIHFLGALITTGGAAAIIEIVGQLIFKYSPMPYFISLNSEIKLSSLVTFIVCITGILVCFDDFNIFKKRKLRRQAERQLEVLNEAKENEETLLQQLLRKRTNTGKNKYKYGQVQSLGVYNNNYEQHIQSILDFSNVLESQNPDSTEKPLELIRKPRR